MRPLPKILSAGELQPFFAKTREIRALAGLVDAFFPPDLARQVQLTNVREGELILIVANPPAAAKLRLLAPPLIRYLAKQRWQVNSVSIRVQPSSPRTVAGQGRAAKSVHLSTPSLNALRKLHAGMGDSPAREALGTLIAHQGSKGPEGARQIKEPETPPTRRASR